MIWSFKSKLKTLFCQAWCWVSSRPAGALRQSQVEWAMCSVMGEIGSLMLAAVCTSLRSVQCAVRCAQCAMCTVRCLVYSVQCAVCSVQSAVQSVQCAVFSLKCTMCSASVQCAVCSVHCTVYITHCAVCSVQYVVRSVHQWMMSNVQAKSLLQTSSSLQGTAQLTHHFGTHCLFHWVSWVCTKYYIQLVSINFKIIYSCFSALVINHIL